MGHHTTEERVEALHELCRAHGLALTPQRRAILRAVLDLDDHPNADRVHEVLRSRHLRVSRATVFRTLESFVRHGIIRKASSAGGAVRYDGRTSRHHHLVCMRCDRITDFSDEDFDSLSFPDTRRFGFQVLDLQVELRGICRSCRELEDKR
jgi:Fur family peroxide stress response transcriptional regulator